MWSFDEWYEIFWQAYPSDLCHKRKGDKTKGKNAAKKRVKTEADAKRIDANTREWAKFSRYERTKRRYTDRWPMVSTFFNQAYYDREIPSYSDIDNEFKPAKKCHCGRDVHGPGFNTCINHLPQAEYRKPVKPIGQGNEEWREKMKSMVR